MDEALQKPVPHFEMGFIIVKEGLASKALEVAHKAGGVGGIILLGRGTAKSSILDLWGLEKEHYYEMIIMCIPKPKLHFTIKEVTKAMKLKEPGKGIMFTLPTFGSAGVVILKHLLEERGVQLPEYQPCFEEETEKMCDREFSLIISITNRGYADDAMDAARKAGAEGGIIMHGRGAGLDVAEKFFGITIEHEREMLLNLVEKSKVTNILKAIVEKTGIKTEARGVSFVLPVNAASGVVRLDSID